MYIPPYTRNKNCHQHSYGFQNLMSSWGWGSNFSKSPQVGDFSIFRSKSSHVQGVILKIILAPFFYSSTYSLPLGSSAGFTQTRREAPSLVFDNSHFSRIKLNKWLFLSKNPKTVHETEAPMSNQNPDIPLQLPSEHPKHHQ